MKWRDIAALVKEMTEKDLDQPVLCYTSSWLILPKEFINVVDTDSMALRNDDGSIDLDNGQHYLVLE